MTESAVSIKNLVKRYKSFTAVDHVDIEVRQGEVFGLLGPNGAGKTSILECLEGIRRPDSGSLLVAGCDPQRQDHILRRKLGVQLQVSSLPGNIRVDEAISLVCAWQGMRASPELISSLNVAELMKHQYRQLSTGQQRRLHLLLALLNKPEVVILDEPTAGLDVQSRIQLHDQIRSIRSQGVTVVLATHDMAEAEQLCDRIAIIIRGKVAVCGTPREVTAAGKTGIRVKIRTQRGCLSPSDEIAGAKFIESKDGYLEWKCLDVSIAVIELLTRIRDAGDTVEDLRVERPTLEERFLQLVERTDDT